MAADSPLDRLRDLVLADAGLQAELAPVADPAQLAERLLALAAANAIPVAAVDLAPFLQPGPLGISALSNRVPLRTQWPSPGWFPVATPVLPTGETAIDWAHFGGARPGVPFFATGVRPIAARPFNRLFRWQMRLADFVAAAPDGLREPDGLIFHMSRCGSTLVAQMLAALPGSWILSEPPPLDAIARLAAFGGIGGPEAALRAMVNALGRSAGRPYVVKLDFWQAIALPLYRRAFPSVPWLFLHRDPAEVLVSQIRSRGAETMPDVMPALGIDPQAGGEETQIAQALARICLGAINAVSGGSGLFVDYADLPEAVFSAILPHFGIGAGEARPAMEAAAGRDAKVPSRSFAADAGAKQAAADGRLRAAAAAWLGALRERMNALGAPAIEAR